MAQQKVTLGEAFQELRAALAEGGHEHPGLHHCWIQSPGPVPLNLLRRLAAKSTGQKVVHQTQWSHPDGSIIHSCFLGSSSQLDRFQDHAIKARALLVSLLQKEQLPVLFGNPAPVEA